MKLAAIDIGTNSIHMIVVESTDHKSFEVFDREKTMVKLGAGVFRTRQLSARAFDDGLETIRRYCKLAEARDVDDILAVATSATREAHNGGEFLNAIFEHTGLSPRVISGTEEARLIFRAVQHAIDLGGQRALVFDIGGGSVEVVVGEHDRVFCSESLRAGVQRLLELDDWQGPLTSKNLQRLRGYVQGATLEAIQRARDVGFQRVIGTSGTIRTLGEAANLAAGNAPWRTANAQTVMRKDLRNLSRRLIDMTAEQRARVPGIPEERADSIHLGAVLLVELLELAEAEELTLCDASLREGVILDYLDHHGRAVRPLAHLTDVRRRSVLELAAKYGRDDPREPHIATLALQLFDGTAPLHGLGPDERQLLEYAALLHGVGQYVGFAQHHVHARYLIRHARLRGFSDEELDCIAQVVRYHRKGCPAKRHKPFRRLSKSDRRVVATLASILRIAVALDRGHTQSVKRVRALQHDQSLVLVIEAPGDVELELWAAERKLRPLSRALGVPVTLQRVEAPSAA